MEYDIVVIGGGHAGIEAAMACARLGLHTLMITQNLDTIGKMSCNPAIGGLAKGNMVREIDALGGVMANLIDRTMLQFRMLNQRKGPAVQSPRAQADKLRYQILAKQTLELQDGLDLFMDTVVDFQVDEGHRKPRIKAVVTARGKVFRARAVVLTTGTFLNGRLFIGKWREDGGRLGEGAAKGLDLALKRLGFSLGRMKTGTPARVHKDSIDLERLERQDGDDKRGWFSFNPPAVKQARDACWITWTTEETHRIIRENIAFSPLFSGEISGIGPRYCPSIEDKVIKFPHRPRHQIFVEPEGEDTQEMYLNGMSSSLPEEVQEQFVRSLPGFSEAVIMRPGYAVEYDFMDPLQLDPGLQTKLVEGLFVAGQTNGTSGYEEAAAQGLMAGINAVCWLRGQEPFVLGRSEAYIGVMIDDLVTLGTKEPYRMFTSRAEHRISLRHDSADSRLFEKTAALGLQLPQARAAFEAKKQGLEEIRGILEGRLFATADLQTGQSGAVAETAGPEAMVDWDRLFPRDKAPGKSFSQLLRSPGVTVEMLAALAPGELGAYPLEWLHQVELDVKYQGYVARQEIQIQRLNRMEKLAIPREFDWDALKGLSNEAREKFKRIQPLSMGQASRISGIRNGDLAIVLVAVSKRGSLDLAKAEQMLAETQEVQEAPGEDGE